MVFNRRNWYRGCKAYRVSSPVIVLGDEFGVSLYAVESGLEEALSEFDERFGHRVDMSDPDLRDYGDTPESQIDKALNDGDIRINDGGTMVWVNHYEWMREFPSLRAAKEAFVGV